MSSSECLAMKNKYENVRSQVQNALAYFDGCSTCILESSNFLKDVIIDGKSFDDDNLVKDNSKLNGAKGNLQSIINECNEKITYYNDLYNEALNRERAAMETAKKSNDKNTSVEKNVVKPVKSRNTMVDLR